MDRDWTQQELVAELARTESRLDDGADSRRDSTPSDRLTERTVRYYRTQSLIDPPAGWSGNRPLFGKRHLLQLLALRRLQASGWNLRQIREWMRGAGERELRRVIEGEADGPLRPPEVSSPDVKAARARSRHWKHPVGPAPTSVPAAAVATSRPDDAASNVRTTRVAAGVYLVVDHDAAAGLSPEDAAAATLRVRRLLEDLERAGRPDDDE